MKKKYSYIIFGCLISIFILQSCGAKRQEDQKVSERKENRVLAAVAYRMGFLAAGTNGLLKEVQMDGTVKSLESGIEKDIQDVCYSDGDIWAVGAEGIIIYAGEDLEFKEEDSGTTDQLNCITIFQKTPYAAGDKGVLLLRDDKNGWKQAEVSLQGNVIGLGASQNICLAASDIGEIAYTTDGTEWNLLNYNDYYKKAVVFEGCYIKSSTFWIHGRGENNEPILIYSSSGDVWAERDINYLEGKDVDLSGYEICSITSDTNQMYALCSNGKLLTLPGCATCNKETETGGIKEGVVAYYGGKLLLVDNPDQLQLLDVEIAKQYSVSAETAYEKQKAGAVILDVRSLEEYEEKHIAGSTNMESGEIKERLLETYPDYGQEIIFYCAKGVRSQSAVEQAVELGYVNVYNLGSIENWKYDFEGGNVN